MAKAKLDCPLCDVWMTPVKTAFVCPVCSSVFTPFKLPAGVPGTAKQRQKAKRVAQQLEKKSG